MSVGEMLQGWNAIAEFLKCDVRTAKRWETERGLPVRRSRRTPGEGRASVYALVSEIENWRTSTQSLDPLPLPTTPLIPVQAAPLPDRNIAPSAPVASAARHSLAAISVVVIAVAIVFAASLTLLAHNRTARQPAAASAPPASARPLPRASSPAVQDFYLHATYLLEQRTPETLTASKNDFEKAIAADPGFAPAYAGLAETYDLLREYSTLPSSEAYPNARKAAQRAIALDPSLSDAHAALAYEEFFWEWNSAQADREFQQAISLDPNSALAHHWYGAALTHQARFQEAIRELDRAQMLEPASASVLATRAYAIGLSGHRNQAADLLQDILSRVPDAAPLHYILAQLCLLQPRDIPRFLDQERRYSELRHNTDELTLLDSARNAYQRAGEPAMWRDILATEQLRHPHQRTYRMAASEAALGMNDDAIRDLERLKQQHDDRIIGLAIDTRFAPLRGNPRFQALEREAGLPVSQPVSQ
jgi:Tfp pilus assembly protein PilF